MESLTKTENDNYIFYNEDSIIDEEFEVEDNRRKDFD